MQKELDQAIQQKLKEIYKSVHQLKEELSNNESNLNNISKTHERIQHEQKQSHYFKTKLRSLYKTASTDTDAEIECIRKALTLIQDVRNLKNEKRLASKNSDRPKETLRRGALMKMLQQNALTLPLWIGKKKEPPPPLCGAIPAEPNYVAKAGDMVAALVKGQQGEEESWILAEVVGYNSASGRYEVDDIDEEQQEHHQLSRRRVVPLPLYRTNPDTHPSALFPTDTLVLALYPQTTCFYRALIHRPPRGPQDDYQVLFEDSSYADGYSPPLSVAQRYVIACKETRKK